MSERNADTPTPGELENHRRRATDVDEPSPRSEAPSEEVSFDIPRD